MERNLKEYAKRGESYLEGKHITIPELKQLVEIANNVGVLDAIATGYFVGVCLGYEEANKERTKKKFDVYIFLFLMIFLFLFYAI